LVRPERETTILYLPLSLSACIGDRISSTHAVVTHSVILVSFITKTKCGKKIIKYINEARVGGNERVKKKRV
jgi:hypothetical protein